MRLCGGHSSVQNVQFSFFDCKTTSIKDGDVVKVSSLKTILSPYGWRTREYRMNVMFFLCAHPPLTISGELNRFDFFPFTGRQVQRLRNLKGAKCEEHNHQRPWGPAMLGTRLHVVSVIAPLSLACVLVNRVTSALGYTVVYLLFRLHLCVGWGDSSS